MQCWGLISVLVLLSPAGANPTTLAVAIAVPVGVCVLAFGVLLLWCLRRRRRRLQSGPPVVPPSKARTPAAAPAAAGDLEEGRGGLVDVQPGGQQDQVIAALATQKKWAARFWLQDASIPIDAQPPTMTVSALFKEACNHQCSL